MPDTLETLAKVSTQQAEEIGELKASAIEDDLKYSDKNLNAATTISNSSQEEEGDEKGKKDKEKKKGKAEKPPAVSVYQLFRFHVAHERLMLIAAAIGSIYTGAIMPVSIIIFGQFISNLTGNLTDANVLLEATRPVILILVYLGTSVFFAAYMANSFWILTGENATRRIRSLYLHSILRQDLGWFDKVCRKKENMILMCNDESFALSSLHEIRLARVRSLLDWHLTPKPSRTVYPKKWVSSSCASLNLSVAMSLPLSKAGRWLW